MQNPDFLKKFTESKVHMAQISRNIASKFWLFTWNNYPDEANALLKAIPNLTYLAYGHEFAPVTGTPHLQGYLEFRIRTKLSTIKNLNGLSTVHWEVPKHYNDWEECKAYCFKEGRDTFEWGIPIYDKVKANSKKGHGRGGKRTDVDLVREAIDSGVIKTTHDLEHFPGLSYQGLLVGDRFLRNVRPERRLPPANLYLHGSTGVGKSKRAHELIHRLESTRGWSCWYSFDNTLKWFDGYVGQEIVLFDDFRGKWCDYATLLRVSDRYVIRVPIKGGSTWWAPKVIIFTSCQSVQSGFSHLPENDSVEQFVRRLNEGGGGIFDFDTDGAGQLDLRLDLWWLSSEEKSEEESNEGFEVVPEDMPMGSPQGSMPVFQSFEDDGMNDISNYSDIFNDLI